MKRYICILLSVVMLLTCVLISAPSAEAATKAGESKAISIVFDNSGSMYKGGNQAWCRATYATEVFASMLNEGDILHIYPMNPITIEGKEYSMQNPFAITDASQAYLIRSILTKGRGDTHIESIDCAIKGLESIQADKKYLLVLSDGDVFYRNRKELSANESKKQLDEYFNQVQHESAYPLPF